MADGKKNYVGDTGVLLVFDCGSDISGSSQKNIEVRKPDGTIDTLAGVLSGTNYLNYTIQSGDWDIAGDYLYQTHFDDVKGEVASIHIYNAFEK